MINEQERMLGVAKELLGDRFFHLEVLGYDLHEDFDRDESHIACTIKDSTGETQIIEGHGVGPIDAFFQALLGRLREDYPSLETISIDKFTVVGRMGTGVGVNQGDALATVTIGIRNSHDKHFEFEHESRSVTRSGVEATLRAAEYFVNSENAFITAYKALKSARKNRRQDLVQQYTAFMTELVKNTSYSAVIEQIQAELDT